ncbi:hypothetical protein MPDQ_002801 [Monascus purpureus]|uniref:Uncharacterized protein n=1 Tax=Monascus purpureus TaxID=5098 RepID=A0A507R258_MONPU|nr:hypothetical protein MPDQ_002801 [Monascus purpureus]
MSRKRSHHSTTLSKDGNQIKKPQLNLKSNQKESEGPLSLSLSHSCPTHMYELRKREPKPGHEQEQDQVRKRRQRKRMQEFLHVLVIKPKMDPHPDTLISRSGSNTGGANASSPSAPTSSADNNDDDDMSGSLQPQGHSSHSASINSPPMATTDLYMATKIRDFQYSPHHPLARATPPIVEPRRRILVPVPLGTTGSNRNTARGGTFHELQQYQLELMRMRVEFRRLERDLVTLYTVLNLLNWVRLVWLVWIMWDIWDTNVMNVTEDF